MNNMFDHYAFIIIIFIIGLFCVLFSRHIARISVKLSFHANEDLINNRSKRKEEEFGDLYRMVGCSLMLFSIVVFVMQLATFVRGFLK